MGNHITKVPGKGNGGTGIDRKGKYAQYLYNCTLIWFEAVIIF